LARSSTEEATGMSEDKGKGAPEHAHAPHDHGHVHGPDCDHDHHHHAPAMPVVRGHRKVGRNDPCPCGSGKKYKRCCGRS
jgi:uncharacterized protein YecA (UPF0149 family)